MRYPVFKEGDMAYVKSELFNFILPETQGRLLAQKRQVRIVERRRRNRGKQPMYTAHLGDWLWMVEAVYLMKVPKKDE